MSSPKYKRVVLKLSGEALAGDKGFGINPNVIKSIAIQVKELAELDVEVAVVVGGGNIWRGKIGEEMGMDRATADYMGMLATVMNSFALQDSLEAIGNRNQGANIDRNETSCRAVYPQKGDPPLGKEPGRHLCCGNGKSLFLNRYDSSFKGCRDRSRCHLNGEKQRRRRLIADPKIDRMQKNMIELSYLGSVKTKVWR